MATTSAFLPVEMTLSFILCIAFGNRYRVASGDVEHGFTTFDIALIALEGTQTSTVDANIIKTNYETWES